MFVRSIPRRLANGTEDASRAWLACRNALHEPIEGWEGMIRAVRPRKQHNHSSDDRLIQYRGE